jgi:hypothetical protein
VHHLVAAYLDYKPPPDDSAKSAEEQALELMSMFPGAPQ